MTASSMLSDPGHVQCHTCNLVMSIPNEGHGEPLGSSRCHSVVDRRKPNRISRTGALLAAAAICYVPANTYPIMSITSFGKTQADTILSGVIFLFVHGMWPLAFIVFVASVVVPVMKLVGLTGLVMSVRRKSQWRPRDRARLYRVVDVVGRWSMVDVFVVTVLVALVSLGSLMRITPGVASIAFGGVVILTMLAAESFDPRLIWDQLADRDD